MSSDNAIPKRRPAFPPPAGSPYGMVRRNAFGRAPIQPGLIPMNLLRAHLYPGQPEEVAEGVRDFNQALETGEQPPQLPQRMAFQWHRPFSGDSTPTDPGGGPRKPTASAASLAAAVAWSGGVAKFANEVTYVPEHPAHIEEGEAYREALRLLSEAQPVLDRGLAREANRFDLDDAMPSDAELLAAYDQAHGIVRGQAVQRRSTFIGRAMQELAAQARNMLSPLVRPQRGDGEEG